MLPKLGQTVILKWDDAPDNQEIIGKLAVVRKLRTDSSPYWIDVEVDGKLYSVRGSDCRYI